MMANLPFSMSAVFNKGFFSPSSLPPSLLLAWGAACGPPDAYRQMSLVEQNTLCLTSQAATGLWRKLKGCLPCKDQSIKTRPLVLSVSYPPPRKHLVQQDAVGSFSLYRHNICHFLEMPFCVTPYIYTHWYIVHIRRERDVNSQKIKYKTKNNLCYFYDQACGEVLV